RGGPPPGLRRCTAMLTAMYIRMRNLVESDEGATALEYGILVAFIAIVIIGGVTVFGEALDGFFNGLWGRTGI
ncbi:MAG: Flp family type IVb pilin, partial [Coriobacteriia bacterium]|nr:Flp family type IVb pilin [Coriobacteriia bacterium]